MNLKGVEGKMRLKLFDKARYRSSSFLVVKGHIGDTMIPCKKQPTNERVFEHNDSSRSLSAVNVPIECLTCQYS